MKKIIGLLLLSASSTLLSLAAAELTLDALGLYEPPNRPVQTRRPDLYQADPVLGYRLKPLLDTTYRYPAGSDPLPLSANSSGFRDSREFTFDKGDKRLRVLFVGDSFILGDGVRPEDRLTEVVQRLEPGWLVYNTGMTGWGLDLMIRALEHHVQDIRPDVVVLCVYTDIFRRLLPNYAGVGFEYPKFELRNGTLVSVPYRYPGLFERMHLVQAWIKVTGFLTGARNRYELNEALLDRFLDDARRHNFEPVAVFLPGRSDTFEDRARRGFLRQWSGRRGVAYLDLTGPIHSAGVSNAYIKNDWHWNPEGHRIAGERIRALLADEALNR